MASSGSPSPKEEQIEGGVVDLVSGNEHNKTKKAVGFIPLDIIIDILSRVPGSSLIRFRLVCKLWHSLTYDPRLVDLHLDRASRVAPPRVMLFFQNEEQSQRKFHFNMLEDTWKPRNGLTSDSDGILSTPPCNGLVCLYDYHHNIRLCNPTTREFLHLPRPTRNSKSVLSSFPKCFLGFHPVTKKYKVVRFFYHQMNHVTESYDLGCEVFTLGTWSWKYVGSIDCYLTGQGINANGYLYWTKGVNTVIPDQIVAFDLESEKFNSIAVPDFLSYQIIVQGAMFLVQLEGKLCVVNAPYDSPGSMDAWMLEDPINNVWIHRFSISLHSIPGYRRRPEPVFIHNGRVLLRWLEKLFYRSLDNEQEDTECVYTDNCLNSSAKAYAFVESLVSLDSENHHSFIS
ncbi:F-box protein At1g53790-like [Dioscorea cayenensis subsp. rotundata]|uniref:F-box protein At1g53790-like n=1 Tax=Dioscorea cayennensis subsp. rotundata TaxID=55577 RepID=A0AB40B065_DIOCR|nr:F-box protein At1g53790-like [Dioscorea cayenensis subsp. rotundata]